MLLKKTLFTLLSTLAILLVYSHFKILRLNNQVVSFELQRLKYIEEKQKFNLEKISQLQAIRDSMQNERLEWEKKRDTVYVSIEKMDQEWDNKKQEYEKHKSLVDTGDVSTIVHFLSDR